MALEFPRPPTLLFAVPAFTFRIPYLHFALSRLGGIGNSIRKKGGGDVAKRILCPSPLDLRPQYPLDHHSSIKMLPGNIVGNDRTLTVVEQEPLGSGVSGSVYKVC